MIHETPITILPCPTLSSCRDELEKLIQSEWEDFHLPDPQEETIPEPLMVVQEDRVIAGLSYTLFAEPEKETNVIWINALVVSSEHRGRGIASHLVQEAVRVIKEMRIQDYLYVYTDVPGLYLASGWSIMDVQGEDSSVVMNYNLRKEG